MFPKTLQLCAALTLVLPLLIAGGCKQDASEGPSPDAEQLQLPLSVLVIEDEPLAEAVKLAWDSRVGGSMKIKTMTASELLEGDHKRLNADVILYPSFLLGELAERELIEPLSMEDAADPKFDRQSLFELIRLREITWGSRVYAVPLGSPQFTLFYRKDIFDNLELKPPATWEQYASLAKRLSDRSVIGDLASPNEEPWAGAIEPLAPTWGATLLLARAAAYARHRNQYSTLFDFTSLEPLIASPPFERAASELAAIAAAAPAGQHSPADVRSMFLAGQCAMAITWPSRAGDASADVAPERNDWIGIAELPGSRDVFNFRTQEWESRSESEDSRVSLIAIDGRLGSVAKSSRYKQQALGMLFMISGNELGASIGASSSHTTLFRTGQLGQENAWVDQALDGDAARQYGEVVQSAHDRAAWLDAIRIPGRANYLAALNQAVSTVVAGDKTPTEALQAAAAEWNEITDSIGREAQQRAYMRSLGLEP